jgi:hypothetical protein
MPKLEKVCISENKFQSLEEFLKVEYPNLKYFYANNCEIGIFPIIKSASI